MTGPKRTAVLMLVALAASFGAACSAGGAAPIPSGAALTCADQLELKHPPRLTLGTNNPATPPWWGGDPAEETLNMPAGESGWIVGNPYAMEGFEGGVTYSLANALGYESDEIDWLPIANADALSGGRKPFDFHIAQVTTRLASTGAVDVSDSYYSSLESVIATAGQPITSASSVAALAGYRLGVVGGSSGEALVAAVVKPQSAPQVFADVPAAVAGLRSGVVDGLVVDVNVALYLRDGWHEGGDDPPPLADGAIVGRFPASVWTDEYVVVLERASPLTACVNAAIDEIRRQGLINEYTGEYIVNSDSLPTLQ